MIGYMRCHCESDKRRDGTGHEDVTRTLSKKGHHDKDSGGADHEDPLQRDWFIAERLQ